jgi:hypothetical protein
MLNLGPWPRPAYSRWNGFWAQFRRTYATLWPEMRDSWREQREQWWETIAEIRQARQLDRGAKQRITGLQNPTRRQVRHALREHREDDYGPT